MSFVVYTLELTDGHYYVGRTKIGNFKERMNAHRRGTGSAWTKMYKPVRLHDMQYTDDILLEDCSTKRLMITHGIDKVRGGAYTMVDLPDFQLRALQYELRSCTQSCYTCGSNTHFAIHCPNKSCKKYNIA